MVCIYVCLLKTHLLRLIISDELNTYTDFIYRMYFSGRGTSIQRKNLITIIIISLKENEDTKRKWEIEGEKEHRQNQLI